MIIGSVSAADITLNPSNATNFKSTINTRVSGDTVTLNPGADYNLNANNVNITINKNITIKSSNSQKMQ